MKNYLKPDFTLELFVIEDVLDASSDIVDVGSGDFTTGSPWGGAQ